MMARIRMISPGFFDDPDIADLSPMARLFFIGLWTQADREGRLVDDMRRLKARLFPFDAVEGEALAVELHGKDFIRRYSDSAGRGYIWIKNFTKHQRPHPKETASLIAACDHDAGIYREKVIPSREKDSVSPVKNVASKPDPNSDPNSDPNTESPPATDVAATPAVLEFPCKGSPSSWSLSHAQLAAWMTAYQQIDVFGECRKARQWVLADPKRRKTSHGMLRFLVGWLNRASDKLQPAEQPDNRGHVPRGGLMPTPAEWRADCTAAGHDPSCNTPERHGLRLIVAERGCVHPGVCQTMGECTAKALAEGRMKA